MKTTRRQILPAAAFLSVLAFTTAQAQQVFLPENASDVPGPAAGNTMTKEYVQMVGFMAFVWGYAVVNSHNRRAGSVIDIPLERGALPHSDGAAVGAN